MFYFFFRFHLSRMMDTTLTISDCHVMMIALKDFTCSLNLMRTLFNTINVICRFYCRVRSQLGYIHIYIYIYILGRPANTRKQLPIWPYVVFYWVPKCLFFHVCCIILLRRMCIYAIGRGIGMSCCVRCCVRCCVDATYVLYLHVYVPLRYRAG
jgi:hypothetical protein